MHGKYLNNQMKQNPRKKPVRLPPINDNDYDEDDNNNVSNNALYEEEEEEYNENIGSTGKINDNTEDDQDDNTTNLNEMSFTGTLSGSISPMELLSAQLKIEQQKSEKLQKLLQEERERISKLEEMLHEELEKNDKLAEEQKSNQKIIDDLKAQLDKVDHENGIGLLREENSSLMDQIEELQTELNKKQKQQGTAKLESEFQRAKEQLAIKDTRIEQLNNKNKSYQKMNDDLKRENEILSSQIDELHQKLESVSKEPKPRINKGYQPHKPVQSRFQKVAHPEGYDPQRFGFKPRPTSAEDHIPHSKLPRFPGNSNKNKISDDGDANDDSPQPVVTKPQVKRPKLGQLKPLKEQKPQQKAEEEFIEDKLPVAMNKVNVSFDDDAIIELDNDSGANKKEQQKIESPSVKKANSPPPRRALVDNIQFDDGSNNDDKSHHSSPKPSPPPEQPQPPSPNKKALQSHITFNDDDQSSQTNVPPPIKLSGLSANELRAKVDQLNQEKAEIERQLNKALPKGKIMMHVRQEREEMEEKLDGVVKDISKLKLELHFVEKK